VNLLVGVALMVGLVSVPLLVNAAGARPRPPRIEARLANLGSTALAGSPADFSKFIADETEKWGQVIRVANIKPE